MSKRGERVKGNSVLCTHCKKWKPKTLFKVDKRRLDRPTPFRGRCLECRKDVGKEYRKTRPKWTPNEEQRKRYAENRKSRKKQKPTYRNIYYRVCDCGKIDVMKTPCYGQLCQRCQYDKQKETMRANYVPTEKKCPVCSNKHNRPNKFVCSRKCSDELNKQIKYNAKANRRAKKKSTRTERINRLVLLKRDRHRCLSCSCSVQVDIPNQPNSAHIDHIYPISKGGTHTYDNLQILCMECNTIKSDTIPVSVSWHTWSGNELDFKKKSPMVLYLTEEEELTSNIKDTKGVPVGFDL